MLLLIASFILLVVLIGGLNITTGPSSSTYQALTTSYQTIFEASAPSGAGTDGSPVRLFYFTAAGDAVVIEITRATADVQEMRIDAGETLPVGAFPDGVRKVRAKGDSTSATLKWSASIR